MLDGIQFWRDSSKTGFISDGIISTGFILTGYLTTGFFLTVLSMHLQCVVCLRNKRNNGCCCCWTRGLLDNQKLLDQITVLVYHLMGSMVPTKTDVSLALALNTFVAVLSKGQRKSLTSVIAKRSGSVIWTLSIQF